MTIVVWTSGTLEYNFGFNPKLENLFKETYKPFSHPHFSFKYFLKIDHVREISS